MEREEIIKYIQSLIDEHIDDGYYTDFNEAQLADNIEMACYDVGRYEVLLEIMRNIK